MGTERIRGSDYDIVIIVTVLLRLDLVGVYYNKKQQIKTECIGLCSDLTVKLFPNLQ